MKVDVFSNGCEGKKCLSSVSVAFQQEAVTHPVTAPPPTHHKGGKREPRRIQSTPTLGHMRTRISPRCQHRIGSAGETSRPRRVSEPDPRLFAAPEAVPDTKYLAHEGEDACHLRRWPGQKTFSLQKPQRHCCHWEAEVVTPEC
jgi:hypothetical protein